MNPEALNSMTVKALRDLARELSVTGFSKMRKPELVEQILAQRRSPKAGAAAAKATGKTARAAALASAGPAPSSAPSSAPARSAPSGPPVSELGELPQHYDTTRITLLVQKPGYLYAYWEVREEDLAAARVQIGRVDARLVMRAHNLTQGHYTDIEVHCPVGDWFFQSEWGGHKVRVDIGLMGPDGRFIVLASSNVVELPSGKASDRVDPEWAVQESEFEAIYALSGGLHQGDSAQLQRLMREGWGPSSAGGSRR
jgi:hypothetical protein